MAGVQVPVVMIPRYSCYSGVGDFITIGMDVTAYSKATLNFMRSALFGSGSPVLAIAFQESTDQVSWSTCTVSPNSDTPAANTEKQFTVTLTKRWFRVSLNLVGDTPVVTCWCVGFFEERES